MAAPRDSTSCSPTSLQPGTHLQSLGDNTPASFSLWRHQPGGDSPFSIDSLLTTPSFANSSPAALSSPSLGGTPATLPFQRYQPPLQTGPSCSQLHKRPPLSLPLGPSSPLHALQGAIPSINLPDMLHIAFLFPALG
ncbi:hypothetical protein GOP47_0019202 [Adiantum capillus-veneris]|uniref:Uncharacterized protein n=1 Tax=Adiantum capillus-veneris TaxID=13818 RepID=A0A9D4Z8V6_ADICA|nr:hypothetical protein GOP47_0019202 [Adiantum capillus-veneris]